MEQIALEVKRGDSKSYTLYFKDEKGIAIPITDYTVFFTVKENIDDGDEGETGVEQAKIKKTITSHIDPANGKTQIQLTSEDTNLVGNYIFDIQIKTSINEIITVMEGVITFTKDVTQRTS